MIKLTDNIFSPISEGAKTEVLLDLKGYPITEVYQKYNENRFPQPTSFDLSYCCCNKTCYKEDSI